MQKHISQYARYILFLGLSLFFISSADALTFDWETATNNGTSVTQTVGGVTATATNNANDPLAEDLGGTGGTSGNVVSTIGGTNGVTVSFSEPVDITTVRFATEAGEGNVGWTFFPTGGSNSNVGIVSISEAGTTVTLNWTNVTSFTASGGTKFVYHDSLVFTPSNIAPTASGVPTDITVIEDATSDFDLSAVSFSDSDGDTLTVTLAASAGTFAASSGGSVTIGGSGTGTLTLAGTQGNINTYLDTTTNIKYSGVSNASGDDAATFTLNANDGTVNPQVGSGNIDITDVNDAPAFTATGTNPAFTEGGAAQILFSGSSASNVESSQLFAGLALYIFDLENGADEKLIADGTTIALTDGNTGTTTNNNLSYNIYISLDGATALVDLLSGSLTEAEIESIVDNLQYENTSQDPGGASRTITLDSISDNGGTSNGGNAIGGAIGTSTVTVQAIDDEPTLTATGLDTTFYVGGAAVDLFSTVTASTVESGQTFTDLLIEVEHDAPFFIEALTQEFLEIDGATIELLNGNSGTTTNFSYSVLGYFNADTMRVYLSGGTVDAPTLQTIIDAMTYRNTSTSPDGNDRDISITSLSDSGTDGGSNDNLNDSLVIQSTVTTTSLPVISNVSVDPSGTSAVINWETNVPTSSDVGYAPSGSSIFTSTGVLNTAPRVTTHAIPLTGLSACSQYTFTLQSIDAFASDANTSYATFITTGCDGTVNNFESSLNEISNTTPTSFTFGNAGDRIIITPSVNYSSTCDAVFQASDLVENEVLGNTGTSPTDTSPSRSYALGSICEPAPYTRLTTFDNLITITIEYPDSAITGLNESSLRIYRWSGTSWEELNSCSVDTGTNSVTCTTTQFSTFGMFGSTAVTSSGGGSAPSNHAVDMCSYETGKCTNVIPYRGSENYSGYQACVKQGNDGYDCATAWALGNDYVTRETFNTNQRQVVQEEESFRASAEKVEKEVVKEEAPLYGDVDRSHPAFEAISWMTWEDIVTGYPDGTFRPDASINRVEFLKIVLRAAGADENAVCMQSFGYGDVQWSSWYGNYVQKASCENIVQGYPDETFRPADTINFVEAAKVAVMALGLEITEVEGSWYAPYLKVLKDRDAFPSTISDNAQALTRGEMAQIVWKLTAE